MVCSIAKRPALSISMFMEFFTRKMTLSSEPILQWPTSNTQNGLIRNIQWHLDRCTSARWAMMLRIKLNLETMKIPPTSQLSNAPTTHPVKRLQSHRQQTKSSKMSAFSIPNLSLLRKDALFSTMRTMASLIGKKERWEITLWWFTPCSGRARLQSCLSYQCTSWETQ